MVPENTDRNQTAFTVSVDVLEGTTTGASAGDRALTAMRLAQDDALPTDFSRPGHLFPLVAKDGGVLERLGHTEASVDLCRLAGCTPVGVIGELMHPNGTMMRLADCRAFAAQFSLPIISVEQLVAYRQRQPGFPMPLLSVSPTPTPAPATADTVEVSLPRRKSRPAASFCKPPTPTPRLTVTRPDWGSWSPNASFRWTLPSQALAIVPLPPPFA
jgi:hypothetical protein